LGARDDTGGSDMQKGQDGEEEVLGHNVVVRRISRRYFFGFDN